MVRLFPRELGGGQLGDRSLHDGIAGVCRDHQRSLHRDRADLHWWLWTPGDLVHVERTGSGILR
ncbi:hypothetical protein D3C80_1885510 [compost metagenome]